MRLVLRLAALMLRKGAHARVYRPAVGDEKCISRQRSAGTGYTLARIRPFALATVVVRDAGSVLEP